jgi:hypothetical protein
MTQLHRLSLHFALLLFLGFALPASAEQVEDFGNYRVHYNAFVSTMLSPQVAKTYKLSRSRYHAIVNITVQKKQDGKYTGTAAKVTGTATNLYGKQSDLKMKKITEQDAIYYLGELPFSNEETLNFNIQVVPEGEKFVHNIRFKQQFFVD